MDTLKEAASSCSPCVRRWTGSVTAERLRVLLATHDDDTVDVFTSGRKMRLTLSPNIDASTLKQGQTSG
jgi:hypothetical protein